MKRLVKNNVLLGRKNGLGAGIISWTDYSINNGSSQNAYLIQEEKDSTNRYCMEAHSTRLLNNLESEIDLNKIDFIVMNHGEIDHSGSLPALMEKIPNTPIYCTANAIKSLTEPVPSSRVEL